MSETMLGQLDRLLGVLQRSRISTLENVLFALREIVKYRCGDSEIHGEDGFGSSGQIIGQEKGRVFGKVAVVEYKEELDPSLTKAWWSAGFDWKGFVYLVYRADSR
jgi:hypothetical protein